MTHVTTSVRLTYCATCANKLSKKLLRLKYRVLLIKKLWLTSIQKDRFKLWKLQKFILVRRGRVYLMSVFCLKSNQMTKIRALVGSLTRLNSQKVTQRILINFPFITLWMVMTSTNQHFTAATSKIHLRDPNKPCRRAIIKVSMTMYCPPATFCVQIKSVWSKIGVSEHLQNYFHKRLRYFWWQEAWREPWGKKIKPIRRHMPIWSPSSLCAHPQ